jgi:hypothetical protein
MRCTIRSNHPQREAIPAITKELARDSVIVLVCGKPAAAWLKSQAEIIIQVALPFHGNFQPRSLEVRAVVTHTSMQRDLLRVTASVHGMTFVDRDDTARSNPTKTHLQEIQQCRF